MLLSASRDGGSDAAHRLHQEIRAHILRQYETAGQWSIMVQIYANLEGLGRKLSSVGIIKTPQDLHAFARSFSLNQPLFSFVDVGSGKERADHKIKGEWTTSMRLSDFLNPLDWQESSIHACTGLEQVPYRVSRRPSPR